MAEVVGLHGDCIASNEPCQDVIELLEVYLAEARRGEIIGICCAVVQGNNAVASQWSSGRADRLFLLAACTMLTNRIYREIQDQDGHL